MMMEPATLLYMYDYYSPENDGIKVEGNIGQGSSALGFAFPSIECEKRDKMTFKNNEVGKCGGVGYLWKISKNSCSLIGYNAAYHATEGISINRSGGGKIVWVLENMRIAESKTNIILRGSNGNERTAYSTASNVWVSALVLENCAECYSSSNNSFNCANNDGAML
jgi:hypothetical protein